MNFFRYLATRWTHLVDLGLAHVAITVAAVLVATVLGVGLGLVVYDRPRSRQLVIATASVFLTIPSLALFGLLISPFGLGPTPVLVALVMYALLPIVANTVVGLGQVDPAVVESARGMGMSRGQRLLRIELPLAWPVILTGMRVSTLLTLGIAAVGAYVSGPGLGNDIFAGLSRITSPNAMNQVLGGTLGVVVLAILFDVLYVLVGRLTLSRGIR